MSNETEQSTERPVVDDPKPVGVPVEEVTVEAEQMAAFEVGEPQWWLIGEGGVRYGETVPGLWEALDEEDTTPAE